MQTTILNDIMELHQFNKINMAQMSKDSQVRQTTSTTGQHIHAGTAVGSMFHNSLQHMGRCALDVERLAISGKCAAVKGTLQCMS